MYCMFCRKNQIFVYSLQELKRISPRLRHSVSCYRIDLYFLDYKLAIKIYENGHSDRNFQYKIKSQRAIEQELGFEFIRNDPDKEVLDVFEAINGIFRLNETIVQSIDTIK